MRSGLLGTSLLGWVGRGSERHAAPRRSQDCRARSLDPACRCAGKARCFKFRRDVTLADCLACLEREEADLDEGEPRS